MTYGAVQLTDEWYAERLTGVTSTDIPAILGLSPWWSEADIAREKLGEARPEPDMATARRYRLGHLLEDIVRVEDELEHGVKLRRVRRLVRSRTIHWALASLDFERVGERTIVEVKTRGATWDEVPRDVEAQVQWQMGVTGYPRAHVALLVAGTRLSCYDLDYDPQLFDGLVRIADDFRQRLDAGGPFTENRASVRRRWPTDTGAEMDADPEMQTTVRQLIATRAERRDLKEREEVLETAIKQRMGEVAVLYGHGWHVTWRRTRDSRWTDWEAVAEDAMGTLTETERKALVGRYTTVKEGFRPFRVVMEEQR